VYRAGRMKPRPVAQRFSAMARKSTRRDFLKGKAAAEALSDMAGKPAGFGAPADRAQRCGAEAPGEAPGAAPDSFLLHVSRQAMACQFELVLSAGQYAHGTEAALEALDLVETLEQPMSYFRPTSQISRLNALAADGPVEVEPWLYELLELAMQLHAQTHGAFDVAAGAAWEAWGFSRRAGKVPSDEAIDQALACCGSHLVQLDPERKTVRFTRPGVRLSLGSLGKGYALDRAGQMLAAAGIHDFLFHAGQSSILARGSRRGPPFPEPSRENRDSPREPGPGWTVGIRHPLAPQRRLGELCLRDRALGTSGSTMQFFRHRGRRYGHILDPRTARPAEGMLSATVVASSAVRADALSTALFVLGPERGFAFLRSRSDLAGVLVCQSSKKGGAEILTAGFSEDELTLL